MRKPFLIASVIGTRPEAIKMLPVVRANAAIGGARQVVICTGQHPGIASAFADADCDVIELPHVPEKRPVGQSRWRLRAMIAAQLGQIRPDLVLVHGDTASAAAGAFAAQDRGIRIAHVEAGLRSFDRRAPWPEEGNRIVIDRMADLLFAPTARAADNLVDDRTVKGRIFVTGNTGIDALFSVDDVQRPLPAAQRPIMLVTCHRKENQGAPTWNVCAALADIANTLPFDIHFVLHPNPAIRTSIERALAGRQGIRLIDPLSHEDMVRLMRRSWAILTDSGGLQEDGAALGRPVLVLRDVTERGEALATGNLRLVGTDPARILAEVAALHEDAGRYRRMSVPTLAFGDGRAAPRIAAAIEEWLERRISSRAATLKAPAISAKDGHDDESVVTRQLETV